ncbi:DUF3800 domain-containing protein [Ramlibacter terrae]|uniref:DUF3800 domain-containing protein n=1 Tax=Ramlibacter terrae TaxID=2732511 RepID=A0ABX6P7P9_9BURK|nr:DUF3800 domain-containing protein [Ramlibacter terrae]
MAPLAGPFSCMTRISAFFDESGDLGWKFDAPFRQGGSSRFFVIAGASGPDHAHRSFGKVIRKLWASQGWTSHKEKKWNNIPDKAKLEFAQLAAKMAEQNKDVHLAVAVLKKEDLAAHLREDQHLLYAHLATQLVGDVLAGCTDAEICPDELNAGAGSSNLLQHLMRHELWFRRGCSPSIRQVRRQKHLKDALEFCDMLAGAAAAHFEQNKSEAWNLIAGHVHVRHGC